MIEDAIKTLLDADAALVAQATGGIYTYGGIKRLGVTKARLPLAFTDFGQLKPLVIVKARDANRIQGVVSNVAQLASTMQIVEIWFYDDGDAGYAVTETMRESVYTLLHGKRIDNRRVQWLREEVRGRDFEQDNACYEMVEYEMFSIKT